LVLLRPQVKTHHHLYGSRIVATILAQNKLTSRQWRHLDRLQQHDYEVKYFPGLANVVADALSQIAYTQGVQSEVEQPKADPQHLNIVKMRVSAST